MKRNSGKKRTVERELIRVAKALNLGVLAWPPLANGVLSELTLSAERVESLDEAGSKEAGFPYYLYNKEMTRGLAYGGLRDRIVA